MFDPASTPPTTWKMLLTFLKLAIPAILTNIIYSLCHMVLIIYAGLLDDPIYVAVIGLNWTFSCLMIFSIMIGLNAAQETLTS